MAQEPRPRRIVDDKTLRLLRPILRYSRTRRAWVLRGVGNHIDPVLKRDQEE